MGVDARPVVATHIYNKLPVNNPHCKYEIYGTAASVFYISLLMMQKRFCYLSINKTLFVSLYREIK